MGGSLYLSSPITTLDRTCKTLSAEAERDAPILAPIQLKFNLMLFIRVPCSCILINFAETSTRPEKNFPFSGRCSIVGMADPKSEAKVASTISPRPRAFPSKAVSNSTATLAPQQAPEHIISYIGAELSLAELKQRASELTAEENLTRINDYAVVSNPSDRNGIFPNTTDMLWAVSQIPYRTTLSTFTHHYYFATVLALDPHINHHRLSEIYNTPKLKMRKALAHTRLNIQKHLISAVDHPLADELTGHDEHSTELRRELSYDVLSCYLSILGLLSDHQDAR